MVQQSVAQCNNLQAAIAAYCLELDNSKKQYIMYNKLKEEEIMSEQADKLKRKKEFYENVIKYAEGRIAKEKEGLILDSGTIRPDIVNKITINRLEEEIREYQKKIADLEIGLPPFSVDQK
jgi:hypothetical protein